MNKAALGIATESFVAGWPGSLVFVPDSMLGEAPLMPHYNRLCAALGLGGL